jgi:hypothetical protein
MPPSKGSGPLDLADEEWGGDGSPPSVTTSSEEKLTVEDFAASACGSPVTTTQIIAQLLQKTTLDLKRRWRLTKGGTIIFSLSSPMDLKESWNLLKELRSDVAPPPVRERPTNQWISDSTWVLVDHRAALRIEKSR